VTGLNRHDQSSGSRAGQARRVQLFPMARCLSKHPREFIGSVRVINLNFPCIYSNGGLPAAVSFLFIERLAF